jgi:putative transposase
MDSAHEGHNVHLVVYHIIWCPKRRRKVLVGPIRNRLEQIVREVAAENDWTVLELAIQPDHVHLLIRADPNTLPSDIPRHIKGRSSHHLRQEFPPLRKLPSMWTRSFFLSTAGNVSQETIRKYIERQSKTEMDEQQTVRKTFKFKLKPTPEQEREQERAMAFVLRRCRELYNAALEERRDAWQKCGVSVTVGRAERRTSHRQRRAPRIPERPLPGVAGCADPARPGIPSLLRPHQERGEAGVSPLSGCEPL